MLAHSLAVIRTLAGFSLLAISFFGWGRFTAKLLRNRPRPTDEALIVLLGWASSLLIFQLINLALPISRWVAIPVFVTGLLMSVPALRSSALRLSHERISPPVAAVAVAFIIIAVWIASRSMYEIENFDSGLYHLSAIRWTNSYALVPGLGNLHSRLAFNQSFFTYASAVSAGGFSRHARGAANSFLFLVVLSQAVQGLWRQSRREGRPGQATALGWGGELFVLPVLAYIALSSDGLTSPTPDLAATLLDLSMFMIFVRGVGDWSTGAGAAPFGAMVLSVIAATAITVKLSTIAFSASMLLACSVYPSSWDTAGDRRTTFRVAPAALIIVAWVARGLVLSGCPLYPSVAGCIQFEWAVPRDKVVIAGNWVYAWARIPGADWHSVLGNWQWLAPWSIRESKDILGFVFPLAASLVALIAVAALRRWTSKKSMTPAPRAPFVILAPVLISILFWFFTAPNPRFGRAFFWMLSISAVLLLLDSLRGLVSGRAFSIIATALFFSVNGPFLVYAVIEGGSRITRISTSGWQPIPQPPLLAKQTVSGLTVYVPAIGEKCWDSPLPCTPEFNPDLALRAEGHLGRGFVDRSPLRGATLLSP